MFEFLKTSTPSKACFDAIRQRDLVALRSAWSAFYNAEAANVLSHEMMGLAYDRQYASMRDGRQAQFEPPIVGEIIVFLIEKGATETPRYGTNLGIPGTNRVMSGFFYRFSTYRYAAPITKLICWAAYCGYTSLVERLLSLGAEVDTMDGNGPGGGCTPLHLAVQMGHIATVECLLHHGARPSATVEMYDGFYLYSDNKPGYLPLHYAAAGGHIEIMSLLVQRYSSINEVDKEGKTPLHVAISAKQITAVSWLLEHGARTDIAGKEGRTPLLTAMHYRSIAIMELLVQHGVQVNEVDKGGRTLLHIAILNNQRTVVSWLLGHGVRTDVVDKAGRTPLLTAMHYRSIAVMELLVQHGVGVNDVDSTGQTPLHKLIASSEYSFSNNIEEAHKLKTAIIVWLIQHGANINAVDKEAATPLWRASQEVREMIRKSNDYYWRRDDRGSRNKTDFYALMRCLLEHGADTEGRSLLYEAVIDNNITMMMLLLQHGANINAVSSDGNTPLHAAASRGYIDAMELLILHGATIDAINKEGRTPLHVAVARNHIATAIRLVEHDAKINTIDLGDLSLVQFLVDRRYLSTDNSLKVRALSSGEYETFIMLLIERGINVDVRVDTSGFTLLHKAAINNDTAMMTLLLQRGANVNATSSNGRTPLHDAASQGHTVAIELLIQYGAEIDSLDGRGDTPLRIAYSMSHITTAISLIKHGAKISMATKLGISLFHGLINERYSTYLSNNRNLSRQEYREFIMLLIEEDTDIDINAKINGDGQTLLHKAAIEDNGAMITFLMQHSANVNAMSTNGSTPLHDAASCGHITIIEQLIRSGAMIDVVNIEGDTILHALFKCHRFRILSNEEKKDIRDAVSLLVEQGADVHARNKQKQTPAMIAREVKNFVIAELLESYEKQYPPGTRAPVKPLPPLAKLMPLSDSQADTSHSSSSSLSNSSSSGSSYVSTSSKPIVSLKPLAPVSSSSSTLTSGLSNQSQKPIRLSAKPVTLGPGSNTTPSATLGAGSVLTRPETPNTSSTITPTTVAISQTSHPTSDSTPAEPTISSAPQNTDMTVTSPAMPPSSTMVADPSTTLVAQEQVDEWGELFSAFVTFVERQGIVPIKMGVSPGKPSPNSILSHGSSSDSLHVSVNGLSSYASSSSSDISPSGISTQVLADVSSPTSSGDADATSLPAVTSDSGGMAMMQGLTPEEYNQFRALLAEGVVTHPELKHWRDKLETYHSHRRAWYEQLAHPECASLRQFSMRFEQVLNSTIQACFLIRSGYVERARETRQEKVLHMVKLLLDSLSFFGTISKAAEFTVKGFEEVHQALPFTELAADIIAGMAGSQALERFPESFVVPEALQSVVKKGIRFLTGDGEVRTERLGNYVSASDIEAKVFHYAQLVTQTYRQQINLLTPEGVAYFAENAANVLLFGFKDGDVDGKRFIVDRDNDAHILLALAAGSRASSTRLPLVSSTVTPARRSNKVTAKALLQQSGIEAASPVISSSSSTVPTTTAEPTTWYRQDVSEEDKRLLGTRQMTAEQAAYVRMQTQTRAGQTWMVDNPTPITINPVATPATTTAIVPTTSSSMSLPNPSTWFNTLPPVGPLPQPPVDTAALAIMHQSNEGLAAYILTLQAQLAAQTQAQQQTQQEMEILRAEYEALRQGHEQHGKLLKTIVPDEDDTTLVGGGDSAQLQLQRTKQQTPRTPGLFGYSPVHALNEHQERIQQLEQVVHELSSTGQPSATPLPTRSRSQFVASPIIIQVGSDSDSSDGDDFQSTASSSFKPQSDLILSRGTMDSSDEENHSPGFGMRSY